MFFNGPCFFSRGLFVWLLANIPLYAIPLLRMERGAVEEKSYFLRANRRNSTFRVGRDFICCLGEMSDNERGCCFFVRIWYRESLRNNAHYSGIMVFYCIHDPCGSILKRRWLVQGQGANKIFPPGIDLMKELKFTFEGKKMKSQYWDWANRRF